MARLDKDVTANLKATYTSQPPSGLGPQLGQPVQGAWVLRVADMARRDVGKLVKWTIEVRTG